VERLLLRLVLRHDPAGVIDIPTEVAAAIGEGGEEGALQCTDLEGGIDTGLGDGEVRGKAPSCVHQGRCRMATTSPQSSAKITRVMMAISDTIARATG
jgi:hypothetical protein